MTKYRQYVERMLTNHKELFESFKQIHDKYALSQEDNQEEFNQAGEKVMLVVKGWEDKLCRQSEKAGYSSYTTSLAEKFQGEVKKHFPLIDHIGLVQKKFTIKRISLG